MPEFNKFLCLVIFLSTDQNVVVEPRTGHFRELVRFEAKTKAEDLSPKAKDFKKCPRGRPWSRASSKTPPLLTSLCRTTFRNDLIETEKVSYRGGVHEDIFLSLWPWPRRSSLWPWPRGLKS